jgi:Protein of unknown function (DUF3570)
MRRAPQLRRLARALVLAAVAAWIVSPAPAQAGEKDADAAIAIAQALDEFMEGKFDEGLGRLDEMLKVCKGKACEPNIRAQIHIAIGILWGSGRNDYDQARASFERALREDPTTTLDRQWATKDVEKAFALAQEKVKSGAPSPDATRLPPTKAQVEAITSARAALAQKDWSACMQTVIAAMVEREFADGKLALAQCQDAGGLLLEATADAELAKKFALEEVNPGVAQKADDLLEKLKTDTPTITLVIPKAMSEVEVKIDGVAVPKVKVDKPIPHNPGKATIEVKGKRGRFPVTFKTTEVFDRGEQITVNVDQGDGQNNSAVIQCILSAKTPADVNLCIETGGKGRGFTFRSGLELATYSDDNETGVFSPSLFLSGENPTAGWQVGGSFLVDVVTTASADIVSTASRRWDEVRYAATLAADYRRGPIKFGRNVGVSIEPDYLALSTGASLGADLFNKTVTPSLSYALSLDTLGRAKTPFDVFSEDLTRHTIDAGVSVVIDAATIAVAAATLELDYGDSSKPYRYVPLFDASRASQIPRGATVELVSRERHPTIAPALEQLPEDRSRFALLLRAAHRFDTATIRGDERLYIDSWGQKASTTDARFYLDLTDQLRLGTHLRFNIQGPVDFWQRAYVGTETAAGNEIPQFRTTDRELGPLFAITFGGGLRYGFTDAFAVNLQVEGIYTQFLDHIYIYDRVGLFTATTFELEID